MYITGLVLLRIIENKQTRPVSPCSICFYPLTFDTRSHHKTVPVMKISLVLVALSQPCRQRRLIADVNDLILLKAFSITATLLDHWLTALGQKSPSLS